MNNQIENKLIEITNSLSQLDSARKQVSDVTSISKDIVSQNAELSKLFGELYSHIKGYSSNIGQLITSNQESLESSLLSSITNWQDEIGKHMKLIEERNTNLTKDLRSLNSTHKKNLTEGNETLNSSLDAFKLELNNVQQEVNVLRGNLSKYSIDPIRQDIKEMETNIIKSIKSKSKITLIGFAVVIICLVVIIALR